LLNALGDALLDRLGRLGRHLLSTGCGVLTAPASERNSIWSVIVPADGTRAALQRNGDFGTSAFFGQLSDKPLLALYLMKWGLGRKAQWLVEKLDAEHLLGVAQHANWRDG
jgi:hypothetical protein